MEQNKTESECVDRYLTGDLSSGFLEKDQDVLSMDIDMIDKKLDLCYDPNYDQFEELQTEKFLAECDKDGFILPEFQLDHLDPLTLENNDMIVAGEILPSTSSQPDNLTETASKCMPESMKTLEINNYTLLSSPKSIMKNGYQHNIATLTGIEQALKDSEIFHPGDTSENVVLSEILPTETSTSDISSKYDIIEQYDGISKLNENNLENGLRECETNSNDGTMTVVAISTNKISNMTQIVINTGNDEQIYEGKTSELIEATGYLSQLDEINGANNCRKSPDDKDSNQGCHDAIITSALLELGYNEEKLLSTAFITTGNVKIWICPKDDCKREFHRPFAMKSHLLAHYGVRPFKCDYEGCNWAFYCDFKLKRHKETHSKRKDYICPIPDCNRRFTTVYNLLTHEKLHSRPNLIACQVAECSERFQTRRALDLHMKSHDHEHAPYVCTHAGCGKRYYSSNALTSHQRRHNYKETDIKCGWEGCGKVFDKPCRLKAHLRSHTGAKPYVCNYPNCESAFSSSSKLKRHEKKHTNERKFTCHIKNCTKAFLRSEHLKEHLLTHEDGRYFGCYMCDARFSAKSSLYVHMKKHQNRENNGRADNSQTKVSLLKKRNSKDVKSVKKNCDKSKSNLETVKSVYSTESLVLGDDVIDTEIDHQAQNAQFKFICPEELCGKIFPSKTALKVHAKQTHSFQDHRTESFDYVFYECQRLGLGEEVKDLSGDTVNDEESTSVLIQSELPSLNQDLHSSPESPKLKRGHGAARTGLTYTDIRKLKQTTNLHSVGPSDVVLSAADLGEELLLSEELPSLYYQDELGSDCQILLLDTGEAESTINLRELV